MNEPTSRSRPVPAAARKALGALTLLSLLPLCLLGALAAAWQSLHTETGTRWWLEQADARLPGLSLARPEGALLGEDARLRVAQLSIELDGTRIRIDGLRLDGLKLGAWQLEAPYVDLSASVLAADRVSVETDPTPAQTAARSGPGDLRLPVTLHLANVAIGRLTLPGLTEPIEEIQARLEASARHRVQGLSMRWQGVQLHGEVELGAEAPWSLQAHVQARARGPAGAPAEAPTGVQPDSPNAARTGPQPSPKADQRPPRTEVLPDWAQGLALDLQAQGPLAAFEVRAMLSMQSQQLEVSARIAPFEALPVTQLDAHFAQLDLAPLLAPLGVGAAPQTALTGSARLRLAAGPPMSVRLQARNSLPGPLDRQRLPLSQMDLLLRGEGGAWQIEDVRLQFAAEDARPAGSLSASGGLQGLDAGQPGAVTGELKLALDGLRPELLDRRGPPLRLSGPIALRHALDPQAVATEAAPAFGRLSVEARLEGSLLDSARGPVPAPLRDAVQLALAASATPAGIVLDSLRLGVGRARLEGQGNLQRQGPGWRSDGRLSLADFDPALWLPGDRDAVWRRAGNRLQGQADWTLESASGLQALHGRVDAEFTDSTLAGQPLAFSLQAQAGDGRLDAHGKVRAGGNRVDWTASLLQAGGTGPEYLTLQVDAPALARLGPLAQGLGLGPLAGTARLDARVEGALGAWLRSAIAGPADAAAEVSAKTAAPAGLFPLTAPPTNPLTTPTTTSITPFTTRGSLHLATLRLGEHSLEAADAEWDATLPAAATARSLGEALLQAKVELRQLHTPGLRLPQARLVAEGSLAAHRASLRATLTPPDAVDASGPGAPAPLHLEARLAGQWQAGDGGAPARWRVQLPQILLQPQPGSLGGSLAGLAARRAGEPGGPGWLPLLDARGLALELGIGARHLQIDVQPGQAELLGTVLRWRAARWERDADGPPTMAVDAEIEPLRVADLLARLQPDFGWGGDLRIGARAQLRSSPAFSASIEIARTDGDLQVSEFGIVQSLGLSEARLQLEAGAGLWRLTELIEGRNLGRLSGQQSLRTSPTALWPDAQDRIEGEIAAHVENLGAWSGWVPAGWRLAGQLDAALRVAGRFGAPELIGEVRGRQVGVRNALEGVVLTDGELDLRFDGDTARLGRMRFKAGGGSLALNGEARLSETPQVALQLQAERATLLGRVDRRVVVSGRATLRADPQHATVDGRLRIDEGLIDITRSDAPSLGDDVSVRRRGDGVDATASATARAPSRALVTTVDLGIDLGPRLLLRGRGIDTRLGGDLRLTTPGGRLTARGEIRTEGGTYEAYGQKLEIARGVITFIGPIENPRLDIEAIRARSDTRVGVTVGGSVQSPRVRLFSDPELPATEKLALLVTGRSYGTLGGADTLLLQRAAFALLAGDGSGASDFNVARVLQLDDLSVRQSDGVLRDTVFTLGKQISDRVYLGYERGLNAATGNWQLIYRIAQRFTLRAQSGEDSALDLIWLFRWN